jgi:signal peptidase II
MPDVQPTQEPTARPASAPPSARTHWGVLVGVAALVVVVDQVVKAIVRDHLARGATDELLGIRLHHIRNDGILGGGFSGVALPVGLLTVVVIVLGLRAYGRRPDAPMRLRIAAGLLLGGAVGNMIDRLRLGYVTDYLARGSNHAFNLADLAIYVGLASLALLVLLGDRRREP